MSTLAFRAALERVAARHGIDTQPRQLPLLDPVSYGGTIAVTGICSAPIPDADHVVFMPRCFGQLEGVTVPLLLDHKDHKAGRIMELRYDADGAVVVRCEVTDAAAMRCPAFSVAAKVAAFTIRREDCRDYVAEVTAAQLTEVGLTDRPFNSSALVTRRSPLSPHAKFYDLMIARVGVMVRLAGLIQELASAPAAAADAGAEPPPDRDDTGDDAQLRGWLTRNREARA